MKQARYYSKIISLITEEENISVLVKKLKTEKIHHNDLSEPVRYHKEIAKAERRLNIRNIMSCGYDCIRENFYVNENIKLYENYNVENEI